MSLISAFFSHAAIFVEVLSVLLLLIFSMLSAFFAIRESYDRVCDEVCIVENRDKLRCHLPT